MEAVVPFPYVALGVFQAVAAGLVVAARQVVDHSCPLVEEVAFDALTVPVEVVACLVEVACTALMAEAEFVAVLLDLIAEADPAILLVQLPEWMGRLQLGVVVVLGEQLE